MAPQDTLPGGRVTVPLTETMVATLLAEAFDGGDTEEVDIAALEECRQRLRSGREDVSHGVYQAI